MADNTNQDDSFDVDIRPDASALGIFKSMSFTPWYALGEFVDNSITSTLKNLEALRSTNGKDYALSVEIDFPDGENVLVVRDNAAGISRSEMDRALRTGRPPKDTSIGLSRHGVGMKAAAFWWGSTLDIKTYPLGEPHGWHVRIEVPSGQEIQGSVRVSPIPARGFPGTEIRVENLWQKTPQKRTIGAIRSYLPSIYRAFLGGGTGAAEFTCSLTFKGEPLRYVAPTLLTAPFWPSKEGPADGAQERAWRETFDVTLSSGKSIGGWYGILELLSRDKSGFYLHYRGKGIAGVVPMNSGDGDGHESAGVKDAIARSSYKPREIFAQVGSYQDQSFVGEFDVSSFGKTITTDSPLWSSEEEAEFVSALSDHMAERDFARMARNFRRRGPAKEESASIKKAQEREAKEIQDALTGNVRHIDGDSVAPVPYEPPPPLVQEAGHGSEPESDLLQRQFSIVLDDPDDHQHRFTIEFIADRSADFIGLYEERNFEHTIRVNRAHPALDEIPDDEASRQLLWRIAAALGSAEVFITSANKRLVRQGMNEHLHLIGRRRAGE